MITGSTRIAAVIGSNVRASLSPAIYNAAFAALDLDWCYVAFVVADGGGANAVAAMRVLGLGGMAVTIPHKHAVSRAVDLLEPAAQRLGSVNCVVPLADGRLLGASTDGDGYVDSLRAECGVNPHGRRVVVLGAGGAARSIIDAVGRAGAADIAVVNRTESNATAAALLASTARVGAAVDIAAADIVVNTTSVGMGGTGAMPCDPTLLHVGQVVTDIVYQPLETAWLAAARASGATVQDGLGMLVHQAVHQFRRYTGGAEADPAVMRSAAIAELAARSAG